MSELPDTSLAERNGDASRVSAAEATELVAPAASAAPARGSADPRIRERCALLGIAWHDKAPEMEGDASALLAADVAVRLRVVPLRVDRGRLVVAMMDPLDVSAADEVAALTSRPVTRVGMEADIFGELMRRAYGTTAARIAESLAGQSEQSAGEPEHNLDAIDAADVHRMAEQPTLVNLVNLLILEAIQSRTSDIHVEPFENDLKVKYRVDGVLLEQPQPPKHLQAAIIGRIKIMAVSYTHLTLPTKA